MKRKSFNLFIGVLALCRGKANCASMFKAGFITFATVFGCGAATAEEVTVFAAASLQGALDTVIADFETRSGHDVIISYAGSSTLARQIQFGAPADIFISANEDWAQVLVSDGIVRAADVTPFVTNDLVIAGRMDGFDWPDSLVAGDGLIAMGLTESVPAGIYGKQAFTALGLWDVVVPRVVQADNVRAALWFVERGEAEFGVVYRSDIGQSDLSVLYQFDSATHDPIVYPLACISDRAPVRDLCAYLTSEPAIGHFIDAGFRAAAPQVMK